MAHGRFEVATAGVTRPSGPHDRLGHSCRYARAAAAFRDLGGRFGDRNDSGSCIVPHALGHGAIDAIADAQMVRAGLWLNIIGAVVIVAFSYLLAGRLFAH